MEFRRRTPKDATQGTVGLNPRLVIKIRGFFLVIGGSREEAICLLERLIAPALPTLANQMRGWHKSAGTSQPSEGRQLE